MNAVATVLTDLTLRIMLLLGASAVGVDLFPGEMGGVYEEEDDWGDKEHADDFSSLVIVSEDNDTDFK
jgi:hypothetical protein